MRTQRTALRRYAPLVALVSVLALGACGAPQQQAPDPLAAETPFSVLSTNESALEGTLFGLILRPFQEGGKLQAGDFDAFRNAFVDTTLAADGTIEGRFIAPRAVPRINDNLFALGADRAFGGGAGLFIVFFPPEGCTMETTNPDDAALAQVLAMGVWDGDSLTDAGFPDVTGRVLFDRFEESFVGDRYTETFEAIIPVVARAPWSASSNGPCTFEQDDVVFLPFAAEADVAPALAPTTWSVTVDAELDLIVGWQFLHTRYEYVSEPGAQSETFTLRTLAIDDVDDLSDLWSVVVDDELDPASAERQNPVIAYLFR